MPGPFRTIRTLTAASAADSAPTVDSDFVDLGAYLNDTAEVRFADGALGGTVAADSVTIDVWRKTVQAVPGEAKVESIDRVATYTIAAADIAKPLPVVIDAWSRLYYATLAAITGGTAPTVTLTIQARLPQVSRS